MTITKCKQTEIGEIPEEWEVVRVKDLGEVVTGTTPRTAIKEYWNGSYPFVTPTDISESKYVSATERTVSERGLQEGRCIPRDAVLVTCIASIGKIAMASQPCITNQQINAIICVPKNDPQYVYYAIEFRTGILKTWAGQTQKPIVKKTLFEKFPIPRPPLPEQQKIAEILSTVDEAIQKTDDVIAKTEELKKGLMQQLLIRGIGHKRFKKTKIGEIPEEWEVRTIKDVCHKPQYGYTQSASMEPVGPKFLRITDIQDGGVDWESVPFCHCPEDVVDKYLLQSGDILFARTGATTGKSYLIQKCPRAVFGSYLIRLTVKQGVEPRFLFQFFNSMAYWKQVKHSLAGSAQGGVNATLLSNLKVQVPPPLEQQRIADILFTFDDKIEMERRRKEHLEELKKGLMQVLLTGKIRVKV